MKRLLAVLTLVVAAVAFSVTTAIGAAGRSDSGVVYAAPLHTEGKDLYVGGDIKDKILGRGAIIYITRISAGQEQGTFHVTARKITAYFPNGTLSGTGSADQTISGSTVTVKNGVANLTTGTGKLKGHSLKVKFSGDQKNNVYKFTYKGTYK
jgi:hypothetical protein